MRPYLGVLGPGMSCLFLSLYCIFMISLSSASPISKRSVFSASDIEYAKSSRILSGDAIDPVAPTPKVFGGAQRDRILKRGEGRRQWSPAEDELLLDLRDGLEKPWTEVAESFPTRSLNALQVRFKRLKDGEVGQIKKLDYWTPQEDGRLLKLVEKGLSAEKIAERFSKRSLNAIRSHYYYLTGNPIGRSKRGKKFTAEEEELLLKLGETDLSWKEKAEYFENRSENSLTQRYHKIKQNQDRET